MPDPSLIASLELVRLKTTDEALLAEANALFNRTQGEGLFSVANLVARLNKPEAIGLACLAEGTLVGAGFAEIVTGFEFYTPFEAGIAGRLGGKKVGSLATVSVEESLQGRGMGQWLAKARLDHLKAVGCDWVLSVSWVSGQAHTSRHVFDRLGFNPVREVPSFYRSIALERPFSCPGCQRQPCECSAILYEFDLRRHAVG